jgi:hypothetical protein
MLRDFFHDPPICRGAGLENVIDTPKVMRSMLAAVQQRLDQPKNQKSQHGRRLLHMLRYHDLGEAWDLIHDIVRDELNINQHTSHIGVMVRETLTCTPCKQTRTIKIQHLSSMWLLLVTMRSLIANCN